MGHVVVHGAVSDLIVMEDGGLWATVHESLARQEFTLERNRRWFKGSYVVLRKEELHERGLVVIPHRPMLPLTMPWRLRMVLLVCGRPGNIYGPWWRPLERRRRREARS